MSSWGSAKPTPFGNTCDKKDTLFHTSVAKGQTHTHKHYPSHPSQLPQRAMQQLLFFLIYLNIRICNWECLFSWSFTKCHWSLLGHWTLVIFFSGGGTKDATVHLFHAQPIALSTAHTLIEFQLPVWLPTMSDYLATSHTLDNTSRQDELLSIIFWNAQAFG